jgi:VIT1/CCC1 family predicted Fe2+/Mn2+ transporter
VVHHQEQHRTRRAGWLRAAVLGANDGIVSTASLVLGVAAADASRAALCTAGIAGLVAGAMSMAAGEYVSVRSQTDTERADLARERAELADEPGRELEELTQLYVQRGLDPSLAEQLTLRDALAAHAQDELGIAEATRARPVQAALASAATFAVGAALPLAVALLAPAGVLLAAVAVASLLCLAGLGALAAAAGGAPVRAAIVRVTFWGALAMAITAGVGAWFGTAV